MEYPEIQVVTIPPSDTSIPTIHQPGPGLETLAEAGTDEDQPEVSPAKQRFIRAVLRVLADIATMRDQEARDEVPELGASQASNVPKNGEELKLPPIDVGTTKPDDSAHGKHHKHRSKGNSQLQVPKGDGTGQSTNSDSSMSTFPALPDISQSSPRQRIELKGKSFGMHLTSLVRLAKFRKMMQLRSAKESSTCSESDEEEAMPNNPRFCATLSPEAQYATLKGYEDLLLDYLKTDQPQLNKVLYRVKTPHQTVVGLKLADHAAIKDPKPRKGHTSRLHLPRITKQVSHVSGESLHSEEDRSARARPGINQRQHSRIRADSIASQGSGTKRTLDFHRLGSAEKKDMAKDRQIRLTYRFEKAMCIVDTLRESRGLPVLARHSERRRTIKNPLATYNTWSQGWAREFQFKYSK